MLDPYAAGRMIQNRGDLKRRAVNFRRGQDVRLSQDLRGRIEQVIDDSQADFEVAAEDILRNMRDAWHSAEFNRAGRARYYEWIQDLALELKGQGGLFGFPLLTLYADNLKSLTQGLTEPRPRLHKIIGLNIDAIAVVLHRRLRGPGGPVENKVAEALRDAHKHFRLRARTETAAGAERKLTDALRQLGSARDQEAAPVAPALENTGRLWPHGTRLPKA